MDQVSHQFLLSVCVNPALIIDRAFRVVALNAEAERSGFREGREILSHCTIDGSPATVIGRCFKSTSKKRFQAVLDSGQHVDGLGWRLGGPFHKDGCAMIQFLDVATARTHFVVAKKTLHHSKEAQRLTLKYRDLEDSNRKLGELVTQDQMTGLMNAQAFRTALEEMTASDQPFALLYLDLNGLKTINDEHGHLAGDKAIISLSRAISSNIRSTDIGARMGGDEFAILANGAVGEHALSQLADRIQNSLTTRFVECDIATPRVAHTAIGVARWPQDAATPDGLEAMADRAMYHCKAVQMRVAFASALAAADAARKNRIGRHIA